MSAVLRIALSVFSFVPLQRVLNIVGAAVAVPALLWALVRPADSPVAAFFMFMGVLLIVLTPLFGGGAALRYASTPSLLHLRPHGRLRLLLGAVLGITLVAALVALPMFVLEGLKPPDARLPVPGGTLFPVMWLCTVLAWIWMFCMMGGRRQLLPLMLLFPFAFGPIAKFVGTSSFGAMCFTVVALAAFLAFPIWYARTDTVRRPGMSGQAAAWGFGGNGIGLETRSMPTGTGVLRQYLLGSASLVTPLWSSLMLVVFMGLMAALPLFMGKPWPGLNPFLYLMLATMGMSAATQGHLIARRARLLWLRAGLDRDGLFVLAERIGMTSSALAYLFPMAALLGAALFLQPEMTSAHLAFGMAVLASAACMFHAGMSTTHDWDFADIALMTCLALAQIPLVWLARPGAENSITWALGFTVGFSALTPILRAHARRRWQLLDWRVMRMLQTTGR